MAEGTCLVTGGARGIGRAIVETLVAEGRTVAFTWTSDEAKAQEVERASDGAARAFRLDLRDRERPQALVDEIEDAVGPIEGLVNNAGVHRASLLALTSDRDWDDVLEVNLGGVFRMCRAALRAMTPRRRGSIVNVLSLSALHGVAGDAAYAASKAGALAMTKCLAREMGRRNIRVNAVVPGFVRTDMTAEVPDDVAKALRARECLPGGTDAGHVAGAVRFLLSDAAAAITGQTLVVDAGTTA